MHASLFRSLSLSSSSAGFMGGGQRLLPRRSKCLSAERRVSELNIMGHEAIVSTEYTVDKITQAQNSSCITKLELEDLVNREEDAAPLTRALQNLLSRDSNRAWEYIKFVDSLTINNSPGMSAANQWKQYARKKQDLWDQIRRYAKNKPIMFTVNLEVEMGTSVRTLRGMLRVLYGLKDLTRIECGGSLYGVSKDNVPDKLADLFCIHMDSASSRSSSSTGNISDNGLYLSDMIVFTLFCIAPNFSPVNNATLFLSKCNRRLRSLTTPSQEDTKIDLSELRRSNSDHNENTPLTLDVSLSVLGKAQGSSFTGKLSRQDRRKRSTNRQEPESGVLGRAKSLQAGPANDVLRRTKSSSETGRGKHDRGSEQLSNGSRLNCSFVRTKPMSNDKLRNGRQSLPQSKRLAQRECPDPHHDNGTSSRSLRIPRALLTKEEGNRKGEQSKPDFRRAREKQGASHAPAFKSHLSCASEPPARATLVAASMA